MHRIPKAFSAQVLEFPRQKPFLGNVVVSILNDFACQVKLLVPKERFPQFIHAGWIMNELQGFKMWAKNERGEFEGDVFCLLEAICRVFNAVLIESKLFIQEL